MKNQMIEICYTSEQEENFEDSFQTLTYKFAKVENISDEVTKLRRVINALFDESDTRVPKGFDQKSDEYAPRVAAHNLALAKLTRVLQDVGYRE